MARLDFMELTTGRQALLDSVARDILAEWPHLEYGEFDVLEETYMLALYRQHASTVDTAQEFTVLRPQMGPSETKTAGEESDGTGWYDS